MSNEDYHLAAWTLFQLSDPEYKRMQWGTYELNIFRPPVAVPIFDVSKMNPREGSLQVTFFNAYGQQYNPVPQHENSRVKPIKGPTDAFLENLVPQYDDIRHFEKGDGVDFYVDGARFLPDNVSCVKIIVKAFTASLEKLGSPGAGLPDLETSVYSPSFGYRGEYRSPFFDPSTIVVITLITIDT